MCFLTQYKVHQHWDILLIDVSVYARRTGKEKKKKSVRGEGKIRFCSRIVSLRFRGGIRFTFSKQDFSSAHVMGSFSFC